MGIGHARDAAPLSTQPGSLVACWIMAYGSLSMSITTLSVSGLSRQVLGVALVKLLYRHGGMVRHMRLPGAT